MLAGSMRGRAATRPYFLRKSPHVCYLSSKTHHEKRVLHRFEYSDLSASSEEACRHRLRAGGLEKVNRVRRQGLQSGTPTGA